MSFEDDIRSRIGNVVRRQEEKADARRKAVEKIADEQAAQKAEIKRITDRITEISSSAAQLLLGAEIEIPTLPIWQYRAYGKPVKERRSSLSGSYEHTARNRALKVTTEGWHIIAIRTPGDYDTPPSSTNYSLSVNGEFGKFNRTVIPKYSSPWENGKEIKLEGIIDPRPFQNPADGLRVLESDLFKDALAYVLHTGRTYQP